MLNVYLRDDDIKIEKDIVVDVEKEFDTIKLKGTDLDKKLIQLIEKGQYNDENSYIDRFGYKLHYDDMSTGCKAALCVANLPDKVVNLLECGYNVRDVIIAVCKQGSILMEDDGLTIASKYGTAIDVCIDGRLFDEIDNLNDYIQNHRFK